jgi:hypothetical protein
LETNLKQVFWDEIDLIIRQKNKSKLEQYLFSFDEKKVNSDSFILKNFEQPINNRLEISNGTITLHLNSSNELNSSN